MPSTTYLRSVRDARSAPPYPRKAECGLDVAQDAPAVLLHRGGGVAHVHDVVELVQHRPVGEEGAGGGVRVADEHHHRPAVLQRRAELHQAPHAEERARAQRLVGDDGGAGGDVKQRDARHGGQVHRAQQQRARVPHHACEPQVRVVPWVFGIWRRTAAVQGRRA
eukprot:165279-Prorocentrum_minimum.AAC.2